VLASVALTVKQVIAQENQTRDPPWTVAGVAVAPANSHRVAAAREEKRKRGEHDTG
jgi:hypothetical protein